jgi:hypothetical protein
VTLRARPLDDGVLPSLSVRAQTAGGRIDSVAARSDGSAMLVVPTTDSIDLRVISSDAGAYYSSQARVRASRDTTIDVIMMPTHWRVRKGAYQGSEQRIDLVFAFGSDAEDTRFLNQYTQYKTMLVAWSPASLPIPIGFDTTRLWKPLTTVDSQFFWRVTNDVNAIIGETVFAPAGPVPFAPRVQRTHDRSRAHAYAPIRPHLYWPSVMMCANVSLVPTRPTATDVAYIELVMELARLLGDHPAAWHLAEALSAAQ